MPIQTTYNYHFQYPQSGSVEGSTDQYMATGLLASASTAVDPGLAVIALLPDSVGTNVTRPQESRYQRPNLALPGTAGFGAGVFFGVARYDITHETEGGIAYWNTLVDNVSDSRYQPLQEVSVCQVGRIWVIVDATFNLVAPGTAAYYIPTGVNAGHFTTVATGNTLVTNGTFLTPSYTTVNNKTCALLRLA